VTPSNLPSGVAGTWSANVYTISGTPISSGTFDYTVTTTNSNGCPNQAANGTITVANSLPPYTAGNTGKWSIGTLTWSAPVRAPSTCTELTNMTDANSPTYCTALCATCGNYYSKPCVSSNAEVFCPYPWRVPIAADYAYLISMLTADTQLLTRIRNEWKQSGVCVSYRIQDTDYIYGWVWRDEWHSALGYSTIRAADANHSSYADQQSYGYQLRCVR
jgi:hypothetical protein